MAMIGYGRVSAQDQKLDDQIAALKAAGCTKVFHEKASGIRSDRRELAKALHALNPGDVLVVTRLDRLARSTRDLLNTLDQISKAGASFKSLADTWADTTTPHGKLMVTILGGLAEFERTLIHERTATGFAKAKAEGRVGRRYKLTPHQRKEAIARRDAGESCNQIALSFAVDPTTILRLARKAEVRAAAM
jgi:DNA invertase Pin-like site-specific DNA recombinase